MAGAEGIRAKRNSRRPGWVEDGDAPNVSYILRVSAKIISRCPVQKIEVDDIFCCYAVVLGEILFITEHAQGVNPPEMRYFFL